MSLLETRNKKFNLPIVFIAGVIFLVGLAFFANYLENLAQETNDNSILNEKVVEIIVDKNSEISVDGTKIDVDQLEKVLKIQFDGHAHPVIWLRSQSETLVNKIVTIMEVASKNNYKIILKAVSN